MLLARFHPGRDLCSYHGVIHGGVVALLIDESMTCCLMAHGVVAVTGDLNLRYAKPVGGGEPIEIRTRVSLSYAPLYHVESKLFQGGEVKIKARGRFVRREAHGK
jgi:acyl-coenzyme A thioesterase PaaI-like protein